MKKVLTFSEFLNEASIPLSNPAKAGQELSKILGSTRDVKEVPAGNSNRGPEVEQYLKSVGLPPGTTWCQAYVYWVLDQLSKKLGTTNPSPKTGLVKTHWEKAPAENKIPIQDAKADPNKVRPGMVFIMERGKSWQSGGYYGHDGIVISVDPENRTFTSIEGNTDEKATGEGNKVGINTRKMDNPNMIGFIDWFRGKRTPEFESAISGTKAQPSLADGGTITGQFMKPTDAPPSDKTVGGPDAEAAALAADQEREEGLLGSLLKPFWKPGMSAASVRGTEVTKGEVAKFLGKKTKSQEYQESLPKES